MAYTHRKEEKKWIFWKTQEEKQLRELGVCRGRAVLS